MAPKLSRTPRSLRARQNQDAGGTRKDKKLPVPGLKEHSNLHVKGGLQKTTDMEKDRGGGGPPPLVECEKLSEQEPKESNQGPQESNPEKCEVQPRASSSKPYSQEAEGMAKHSMIYETIPPALDKDLDKEIPLTDSDIESSSAASIWVSKYSTCRRKSVEQTDVRSSSGAKLKRDPLKPREEDGEMQWDYTATQQAFLKSDSACNILVPPPTDGPAEPPSLDLIYRTMVQNHEQAGRESRKMEAANRQLQLSIKKGVKSCQDIGVRITTMETRTEELETESQKKRRIVYTYNDSLLVPRFGEINSLSFHTGLRSDYIITSETGEGRSSSRVLNDMGSVGL
ncbi:hypothetical protein NDU88_001121 [Pleurodeles waltl]|uniref:Uncharacterized protein n=1 Tax=Pleurodeles waltl TaxID=8319 RepID=A0AAV7VWL8_PLEWA|nr:hypothetical protein NDU88_001121 [Pleurodeles waltl]